MKFVSDEIVLTSNLQTLWVYPNIHIGVVMGGEGSGVGSGMMISKYSFIVK